MTVRGHDGRGEGGSSGTAAISRACSRLNECTLIAHALMMTSL